MSVRGISRYSPSQANGAANPPRVQREGAIPVSTKKIVIDHRFAVKEPEHAVIALELPNRDDRIAKLIADNAGEENVRIGRREVVIRGVERLTERPAAGSLRKWALVRSGCSPTAGRAHRRRR